MIKEVPQWKECFPLPIDMYYSLMEEEIKEGKRREMERQRRKLERDTLSEEEKRMDFEKKRNIQRDNKGRLNKGALLAKKDPCSEAKILLYSAVGYSAKDIIKHSGYSKSMVYRILDKYKKK